MEHWCGDRTPRREACRCRATAGPDRVRTGSRARDRRGHRGGHRHRGGGVPAHVLQLLRLQGGRSRGGRHAQRRGRAGGVGCAGHRGRPRTRPAPRGSPTQERGAHPAHRGGRPRRRAPATGALRAGRTVAGVVRRRGQGPPRRPHAGQRRRRDRAARCRRTVRDRQRRPRLNGAA